MNQYSYDAQCVTLSVRGTPDMVARLQADVNKLLNAYERTSKDGAHKRAAMLAAQSVTIKRT